MYTERSASRLPLAPVTLPSSLSTRAVLSGRARDARLAVPVTAATAVDAASIDAVSSVIAKPDFWAVDVANPFRKVGLLLTMALMFLRFTGLHELLVSKLNFNSYILYILGIPAGLCVIFGGALGRTLRENSARYWLAFAGWLLLAVPFSDWKGGSLRLVTTYIRTDLITLFLVAGLVLTWDECWRFLKMMAWSGVFVTALGFIFPGTVGNGPRLDLAIETSMNNPNDYAALLILLVPFLLLPLRTQHGIVRKVACLTGLTAGLFMVLSTGSRGAFVGALAAATVLIWNLEPIQRVVAILGIVTIGGGLMIALPAQITERFANIFGTSIESSNPADDAGASSTESRIYLLKKSLLFTVQNPMFGVGPGEFADHEGFGAHAVGLHGNWHEAHNSYTEVSSEAGVPAAIFFIAALVSTYRVLRKLDRQVRTLPRTPLNQRIRAATWCARIAMIGFCCCIFFLSLAYRFYLPAFSGLVIAMNRAAKREWALGTTPA